MNQIIKFNTTDLASRNIARGFRTNIENELRQGQMVEIDLENVLSISDSFGDELFGILALELGLEDFGRKVKLRNARTSIIRSIAETIKVRLNSPRAA